ncbi:MAG: hypothetical protein K8F36_06815 [Melioribacteraceae bacterium]|nr:hypothetical protein [Melioribacteraceae bacterium]
MAANEKALFTPEEQILKGQREYYNLDLDEHKYLLQSNDQQQYSKRDSGKMPAPKGKSGKMEKWKM